MFGFLNVYKPRGKTSHDVVSILRKITKIKQIGHTGTLDPFAEGVLPICIGKATRLIEYLDDDKAYIGTVQLGQATTTYDTEGVVVNTSTQKVSQSDIEQILTNFRGEIKQLPPIYSAIKVKGKKLYEYARKGENVEITPRDVNIHKLEIIKFNTETQSLELLIECSKGTYIRSIANDIGNALGCYGHLSRLIRIKAGSFKIENSIELPQLQTTEQIERSLIYPTEYLSYPKYELNNQEKKNVSHGMGIEINRTDGMILLTEKGRIIAIAQIENQKAKILKVFI